jgi:hypothetical protein
MTDPPDSEMVRHIAAYIDRPCPYPWCTAHQPCGCPDAWTYPHPTGSCPRLTTAERDQARAQLKARHDQEHKT